MTNSVLDEKYRGVDFAIKICQCHNSLLSFPISTSTVKCDPFVVESHILDSFIFHNFGRNKSAIFISIKQNTRQTID